ncbi:MAG TPA: hypothetical protein PK528_13320 [Syntrophorhabdus sp.]|jgi:hypothetical protein|nr:hypothetical protein [Syntrophorhabdus sp.]
MIRIVEKSFVLLMVLVLLSLSSTAYCDIHYQKDGFSITLPDGWIEIPRDVLDDIRKEVNKLAKSDQHCDYAFQPETSKYWFEYPYILVQVDNSGRIPEKQLQDFENYPFQKSLDETRKKMKSITSELELGKTYYDEPNRICWFKLRSEVINIGTILGLSGLIPTEKGYIQVMGYSLRDDLAHIEPTIESVVLSVKPDPNLVYAPKIYDDLSLPLTRTDWKKVGSKVLAGAIIAGIFGIVMRHRKKNR